MSDTGSKQISSLRKPNDSIHLRVDHSRLTINGIRIFNVIIALVQNETKTGTRLVPCLDKSLANHYWISMPDLMAALKIDRRNKRFLENSVKQLLKVEVTSLGKDEWVYSHLLSGYSLIERSKVESWANGSTWIGFFLHPRVIDHIKNPTARYTPIELMYQNRLSSVSAIRLYEHCLSYLNLGRTNTLSVDCLVSFLKAQEVTEKKPQMCYRDFKKVFLNKAIAEVNSHTNVFVKLKEKRKGRWIDEVYFEVLPRIDEVIAEPVQSIEQTFALKELQIRLTEIGFSAKESAVILAQNRTERVKLALEEFDSIVKKGKSFTSSAKAYFRGLLGKLDEEIAFVKQSKSQMDWINEDRISDLEREAFEREQSEETAHIAFARAYPCDELEVLWQELLETMDEIQRAMFVQRHPNNHPKSMAMLGRYIMRKCELGSMVKITSEA